MKVLKELHIIILIYCLILTSCSGGGGGGKGEKQSNIGAQAEQETLLDTVLSLESNLSAKARKVITEDIKMNDENPTENLLANKIEQPNGDNRAQPLSQAKSFTGSQFKIKSLNGISNRTLKKPIIHKGQLVKNLNVKSLHFSKKSQISAPDRRKKIMNFMRR